MGFEILEQYGSNVQAILVPGSENNLLKALKCSIKSISPQVQIIVSLTLLFFLFSLGDSQVKMTAMHVVFLWGVNRSFGLIQSIKDRVC